MLRKLRIIYSFCETKKFKFYRKNRQIFKKIKKEEKFQFYFFDKIPYLTCRMSNSTLISVVTFLYKNFQFIVCIKRLLKTNKNLDTESAKILIERALIVGEDGKLGLSRDKRAKSTVKKNEFDNEI